MTETIHDIYPSPTPEQSPAPRGFLAEYGWFIALVLVIFIARSSLVNHYVVPSGSMEPTVQIGDRVFVDMTAYGVRIPFTI